MQQVLLLLFLVKQVSTTEFEFYGQFNSFTGASSFYTVEHRHGTWTHDGTDTGTSAPTGTVLTATERVIFTSGSENQSATIKVGGITHGASTVVLDGSRNLTNIGTITASGDMAIDTDTLFVDVSANRVGIGEDSVDMKLHISDTTTPGIKFERPGTAAWRAGVSGTSFQISDSSDTLASPELVLTNSGRLQVNHDAIALASQPAVVAQFDSTGTDGTAQITVQNLTASTAAALAAGIEFKVGDGTSGSNTKSSYIRQRGAGQLSFDYIADKNHFSL